MEKNEMSSSREDYLEAILIISRKKGNCHSIDVANFLNFSKPSVSNAMKKLEASSLIYRDPDGALFLTDEGEKIALKMFERHEMLTNMLTSPGVHADIAEKDACAIEHVLSDETLQCLKTHFKCDEQ